ncbi:glycosyltransferase [Roseibacterium beibuensis]|uniref:Glycosyltransferase n=1 Tax=[Roseibacterium] beibuensis TaxID=1193142 RepID=A0ABP9LGY2_9RHOB|nr:glycosyltransferase [Roseibacterium beibuensis]MCS6623092.1 glycosyltransferase [Roseibacterium beibuensis]
MAKPRLSVVVVSHGRPAALCRCLLGFHQQDAGDVEVVVVADPDGLSAISRLPFHARLKTALQQGENISTARNDGVALAAGDVVAFVDDDAVPAPTWATRVKAAFAEQPMIDAMTGPVIGRNGISLQWGETGVDRTGRDRNLSDGDGVVRKLHGTNMAMRRSVFDRIGGFDPAFAFYLDDTDFAIRMAEAGLQSALTWDMIVHHGFAASARRSEDRVPLSLHDIGASTAVFLRKHASEGEIEAQIDQLVADQRRRLLLLARRRKIDARAMRELMESLHAGLEDGRQRRTSHPQVTPANLPFLPLRDAPATGWSILSGWRHQASRLRREAADLVASGQRVSLFLFEPTPRKHKVSFTEGGWWEQTGGLFGPSDRDGPPVQAWRFQTRLDTELARVRTERGHD